MFRLAVPILGVSDSVRAEEFYCQKLGFRRKYAYRPDPEKLDPCWMGVVRDGAHIVLSSFEGDGPAGKRNVQIFVDDAHAVHREYKGTGISPLEEIFDQTWGNLEFGVKDPDGNRLTFAQSKGS